MALEHQISIFSIDTGRFYSSRERLLHNNCTAASGEKNKLKSLQKELEQKLLTAGYTKKDLGNLKKGTIQDMNLLPGSGQELAAYSRASHLLQYKSGYLKKQKAKLVSLLARKTESNARSRGRSHTRLLNESSLSEQDIISIFESSLTRMMGLEPDTFTDHLIVVRVFYFSLFEDLCCHGFTYRGEPYRFFTSSAGQIRQKKALFIKERIWEQYQKTILCGLTPELIARKGGINANKYLAYMALTGTATDPWPDFDIDRAIVIEDFKTQVFGEYDRIDDTAYTISREKGEIPIVHTDGAGMVLSGRNRMVRAPWMKGLLGVFDFVSFIRENNCSPVITDIYGTPHDVIKEDIRIIFTKSQFKMWRYYDNWEHYKSCFKAYGCASGVCNEEEDRIKNARINYQMLQTLTDLTEEELLLLADKSVKRLTGLCASVENLQAALGVTPYNTNMTPLQQAIAAYPNLLNDPYLKRILRDRKNSLVKQYKSGRLEIDGKYTFILPDFYAACEYWFCGNKAPKGLLQDGEVFCALFGKSEKLDCLRSPHLFKEHAVRKNCACGERGRELRRWFSTNALYTSCSDLISRMLQFDVDGDKALVACDQTLVNAAERNMKNIVPLYYEMRAALPQPLIPQNIFKGLAAAFTKGNIGPYSNTITKIWNSAVFVQDSPQQRENAQDLIRLLCMENNFVIDYAKTLYMPERPQSLHSAVSAFASAKLPAFFVYAEEKEEARLAPYCPSTVNRLSRMIPNPRLSFGAAGIEEPDYRLLMRRPDITVSDEVTAVYDALNRAYHFKINRKEENADNLGFLARSMRSALAQTGYSEEEVCDMLVKYLYGKKSRSKEALWFCYGRRIVENLRQNGKTARHKWIICEDCGGLVRVSVNDSRTNRCPDCYPAYRKKCRQEAQKARRRKVKPLPRN